MRERVRECSISSSDERRISSGLNCLLRSPRLPSLGRTSEPMDEPESQSATDAAEDAGDNDANGPSAVAAAATATTLILASSSADAATRLVFHALRIDSVFTIEEFEEEEEEQFHKLASMGGRRVC